MSTITDIYQQLFGKDHIKDGDVIDYSEHGRVGGLSTGQPFKFTTLVDKDSGNTVSISSDGGLGSSSNPKFAVNDVEEPGGSITYIGKESSDGTWWLVKVDESSSPITIQHASITTDSGQTTYSLAWTNRASLTYSDYSVAF